MISEVAVKSTIPLSPAVEKVKLLQEAAMMVQFHHPNVIQLYGVVVHDNQVWQALQKPRVRAVHALAYAVSLQIMLVLELARNGDLRKYLKNLKST